VVINMNISAGTDVGAVRKNNQDSFLVDKNNKYCIVADGMGGHNAGEVASSMAAQEAGKFLSDNIPKSLHSAVDMVYDAIRCANNKVFKAARLNFDYSGMGTTMVMAYFYDERIILANVGDSRAYLVRNKSIRQITKDHSMVERLVDEGTITREQAKNHPQKNMITRAIGTDREVQADMYMMSVVENDILLLCSDGLSNEIDEEDICRMLSDGADADALIKTAKENGGRDNITAIIIRM
jgi:serine/threonine protein phosphatase PrpC